MRILVLTACFQVIAVATTLTGTLRSPNSYGGATGTLTLAVSQGGGITPACGGGGAVPTRAVSVAVSSGVLQSTVTVVGNDCIATPGTSYNVTFVDASGNRFVGIWKITGTTFDISNQILSVPNNPITSPSTPLLISDLIILHSLGIPEVSYATLPSVPVGHPIFIVTNKQCDNTGSGPSLCHWNGSSWETLGGGGLSGTGVSGPLTNHDGYVPVWSGANLDTLIDGYPVSATPGANSIPLTDGNGMLNIPGGILGGAVAALATLGTATFPDMRACSDCTPGSSPCTGSGAGAYAFATSAGAWTCPF